MEYVAFYDYIKNELCVNREKPELECNGKCYLMKKLAEASDSDSEKGNEKNHSIATEYSIVYFQEINSDYISPFLKEQKEKIAFPYNELYKFDYMGFVFHPPLI